MLRLLILLLPLAAGACSDKSRGAALNECRIKYDLRTDVEQNQLIPACMQARSFQCASACGPSTDEHEWDWQVKSFGYDNPRCYRPIGSEAWIATALSPM